MPNDVALRVAPGMRIEMRSVEWLVKRTQTTGMRFHLIDAVGISDIVRDREMSFILEYEREGSVKILDPADVTLVPDRSPHYNQTLLYIESLLRSAAPSQSAVAVGTRAAIDPMPYQLEPAHEALQATRPRILIADDVGLGKTIEAGILVSELIARGRGKRILVVTTKAMLTQFQKEFWIRFSIALTRLDSDVLQRVKERIPDRHNPFHYFDRVIISIDTLKNNKRFGTAIENATWDIIVIDEAQNVAERRHGTGKSQRARLAQQLTNRSDALLLLSATPHDGSKRSFASLMRMLSPLAIADPEDYGPEDIKGLVVRRFRHSEEVSRDLTNVIPERDTQRLTAQASPAEEKVFGLLANLRLKADESVRKSTRLFRIVLEKALFSSPAACLESIDNRIARHQRELDQGKNTHGSFHDMEHLETLRAAVERIDRANFSRYQRLLTYLREQGWTGRDGSDRLVIFTERIPTLRWLKESLQEDLGLRENQITTMSGDMSDNELNDAKEAFGLGDSPVRLLVASDVAAEGLNLHFQCHRLVHFDLPWSLMTFQQRNGRIDRYGQQNQPQIVYLFTCCREVRIHNDLRILQLLAEKEENARVNIGDVSILLRTNDPTEQEELLADEINRGTLEQEWEETLDTNAKAAEDNEINFLEMILRQGSAEDTNSVSGPSQDSSNTIYPSFFDFATAALKEAREWLDMTVQIHEIERIIEMDVPASLKDPISNEPRWMPREAVKEGLIRLTDNPAQVKESMERALASDDSWPETQFLWEIHPFAVWLGDLMNQLFNRREVPVLLLDDRLAEGESIFLFFGRIPNQAGSTLLDSWIGVHYRNSEFTGCLDIDEVLNLTDLRPDALVNRGDFEVGHLQSRGAQAARRAEERFGQQVQELQDRFDARQLEEQERLDELSKRHLKLIEEWYRRRRGKGIAAVVEAEHHDRKAEVERWKDESWEWYERSQATDARLHPHPRLIAVLTGE